MFIYNVKFKGVSVGMTFNKEEALSWRTTKEYTITPVIYSVSN